MPLYMPSSAFCIDLALFPSPNATTLSHINSHVGGSLGFALGNTKSFGISHHALVLRQGYKTNASPMR